MNQFIGSKDYRLDEKGRVPLLPHWRKQLAEEKVVLTHGLNDSVWGFSPEGWSRLTADLTEKGLPNDEMLQLSLALGADAFDVDIDKQGRVMVPQKLREELKLGEEVVMVGAIGHFEIRNSADWEKIRSSVRAAANERRKSTGAATK